MTDELSAEQIAETKLNLWANQLKMPIEEVKEIHRGKLEKFPNEQEALKRTNMELKRRKRRLERLVDIDATILGLSKARDIAPFVQNAGVDELYVANILGILNDTKQLFTQTLWGKDATRTDIPELIPVKYKGIKSAEGAKLVQISGSDMTFETTGEEKHLKDFVGELAPIKTTLKNLEKYYQDLDTRAGRNVVCVSGIVLNVSNAPSKKGNFVVTLDELSDFAGEEYSTMVLVPERCMIDIERDDEVLIVGDCWKPPQEDGTLGRVQLKAWGIEKTSGSTIRVQA